MKIRMRLSAIALALLAASGCSIAPPPRCCPPSASAGELAKNVETLRSRADGFQRIVDEKLDPHWEYGILLSVYFTDPSMTTAAGYDDAADAALYTGVYAAAQAFRYASARDSREKERALAGVRKAADALHTLATAPGYAGGLARAVTTRPASICQGTTYCYTNAQGLTWLGNTSRDQYTGWWFGNAIVYQLVDDPRIRATIRKDVREMITAIRGWNYRLHDRNGQPNSGTAGAVHHQMRITWHLIAATILDEPQYWQWYREQTSTVDLDEAWLEDAFDVTNVYFDYYGFNLGFLNAYNMVLLERDPRLRARYLGWMERELYRHVKQTNNALFDFMYMAASGTKSAEVAAQDMKALRDFPGPPAKWTCVSPPPRPFSATSKRLYFVDRFLTGVLRRGKMSVHPQSATPYPLSQRCRHEFQWAESPYKETCCCQCTTTGANCPANTSAGTYCSGPPMAVSNDLVYTGADYLVAYWMGRHYGYIAPEE